MRSLYLRRWCDRPVDLRNNILFDSLGLPWFVPKCAQNVPTAGALAPTPLRPRLPSPVPDLVDARSRHAGSLGELYSGDAELQSLAD
jgi:hypothetical protein